MRTPPRPVTEDPVEEETRLRDEIAFLRKEAYGTPIAWPADIPEKYQPDFFKRQMEKVLADCDPGVRIVGFECDEPPCFVYLEPEADDWWDRLVNSCPAWVDLYGSTVSSASGSVECDDGAEAAFQVLGPVWPEVRGQGAADAQNEYKRFEGRIERAKENWRCPKE